MADLVLVLILWIEHSSVSLDYSLIYASSLTFFFAFRRIGLSMINEAEDSGAISPRKVIALLVFCYIDVLCCEIVDC